MRGGELAEIMRAPPQAGTALNEFSFVFHASVVVWSLIYETVPTAAAATILLFEELLELALFVLCYACFW